MQLFGFNMKTVIQTTGWNPFQSYLLVATSASGITGLFFRNESSRVVSNVLPSWILYVWYTGLVLGSVLALIGTHINLKSKLQLEMAGVGILGSISTGYAIVLSFAGGRLSYSVFLIVAFSAACLVRTWQIYRLLQKLNSMQEVIDQ
jgi:hypothetical protein